MIFPTTTKVPAYRSTPKNCIFLLSYMSTNAGDVAVEIDLLKTLTDEEITVPEKPMMKDRRKLAATVSGLEVATTLNLSLLHDNGNSAYSTAGSYLVLKVTKNFDYEDEIETVLHGLGKIADTLVRKRTKATAAAVKLKPINMNRQDKELSIDDMLTGE
jgi:hypothetical protein